MNEPAVTILIPVWCPDQRIIETLNSLAQQTYRNIIVHVSIDFAPNCSLPELPNFPHLNCQFTHQIRRLGWVENVNTLLRTVRTPYFMVLAHDDTVTPEFTHSAVTALEANSIATVAHGITRHHGIVRDGEIATTPSIVGSRLERIMEFISRGPSNAELGWRGIVRSELIQRGLRLRTRQSDGMFSNTLWALELLIHGTSLHVPGVFYDKFTTSRGLSRNYHARNADEKSTMLADNLACLVDTLRDAAVPNVEQVLIVEAYATWLLALQGNWNALFDEPNSDKREYQEVRKPLARLVARTLVILGSKNQIPKFL